MFNMTTITLPGKLDKKEELVAIPRKEYEAFLRFLKIISKDQKWFWTPEWQEKEKEADKDILFKKISPPYKTKKGLQTALSKLKKR